MNPPNFLVDKEKRVRVQVPSSVRALIEKHDGEPSLEERSRIVEEIWRETIRRDPTVKLMWSRDEWLADLGIKDQKSSAALAAHFERSPLPPLAPPTPEVEEKIADRGDDMSDDSKADAVTVGPEMIPLIEEFASTKKQREVIPILDRLWDLAIKRNSFVRQKWSKQNWLVAAIRKHLGPSAPEDSMRMARDRESLRYAPDVIWDKVDGGLAIGAAVNVFRDSKELATKKGITIDDAAVQTLEAYQKGIIRRMSDGSYYYTKTTIASAISGKKEAPEGKTGARAPKADDNERHLWKNIRHNIGALVALKVGDDIEPAMLEEYTGWFEGELSNLRKAFVMKLKSRSTKVRVEFNRVQYIAACRKLHIDPAKVGQTINVETAKSAKKKLLRAYHPDANGGDTSLQHLCEEIARAFDVVEGYSSQMQRSERAIHKKSDTTKGDPHAP